jgi:hypothetical protein
MSEDTWEKANQIKTHFLPVKLTNTWPQQTKSGIDEISEAKPINNNSSFSKLAKGIILN